MAVTTSSGPPAPPPLLRDRTRPGGQAPFVGLHPGPRPPPGAPPAPLPLLRDRIRPGVQILFVGINPGVRSALTGHHFAGFSNRFWKLLYESGLVPERIGYQDGVRLPEWRYGITNIVARATPGIGTLEPH